MICERFNFDQNRKHLKIRRNLIKLHASCVKLFNHSKPHKLIDLYTDTLTVSIVALKADSDESNRYSSTSNGACYIHLNVNVANKIIT